MSVEFSFVCQVPPSKQTLYTFPTLPESKQRFSLKGQNKVFFSDTGFKDFFLTPQQQISLHLHSQKGIKNTLLLLLTKYFSYLHKPD